LVRDPNARGPAIGGSLASETSVDYQDISGYLEVAAGCNFSGFIELPYRFLNPEVNANTSGLADINAGFKYALINNPEQVVTFQFRTYFPSGASTHGLGTDHYSLEPGILAQQLFGKSLLVFGEFKDWIPIDGSDFAGNVLRYGIGASYNLTPCSDFLVAPVVELVGWSVLGGKELVNSPGLGAPFVKDASGETIINAKVGVRLGYGPYGNLYVGYGRALTGDWWYKDIVRVEYVLNF
jgi:hypothetical protein